MTIQHIPESYTVGELLPATIENARLRCLRMEQAPAGRPEPDPISLPTWYAGVAFRSKLEADWAATLDSLSIGWVYEPEVITLPSGQTYIPDFWLPQTGTWLEIKGTGIPRIEKTIELGQARACHCEAQCTCRWAGGELVLIGHPATAESWPNHRRRHLTWSSAHGGQTWLARCEHCRITGWGRFWCRACGRRLTGGHAYESGTGSLQLVAAYTHPAPTEVPHPAAVRERV